MTSDENKNTMMYYLNLVNNAGNFMNMDEFRDRLQHKFMKEAKICYQLGELPLDFLQLLTRYYFNGDLTINDKLDIFGYGHDIYKMTICHQLSDILIYLYFTGTEVGDSGISIAQLFKLYGKEIERIRRTKYKKGLYEGKNFDAVARTKFSISGEKLDKYCHVIDEVLDEMDNNFNTTLILTKESLSELCSDVELHDVMSSFENRGRLFEKIWDENNRLNPRVRLRLLDIADKFYNTLETNWVEPVDVIFTGSLCNYNWSKYSDIDLHIVVDFNKVDSRVNFVKDYFDSKKKIWNEQHEDLKIYGFPVELYVQDSNEEHSASGIYSLYKDKWIVEPSVDNFTAKDLDKKTIASKVMKFVDNIDKLESEYEKETDEHKVGEIGNKVKGIFTKLKSLRKHALKHGGEYAPDNIFYKAIRRIGYLSKLIELKAKTFDKINSIK